MLVIALLYLITLLDQATKWWVQHLLRYGERIEIIPGLLDFRYVRNTGAAWGLFADYQPVLILVSLVVLTVLRFQGRRMFGDDRWGRVTLGLLAAGICGNLIDRLRLGYVVDFIDFSWRGHHFPAFNVADMAITIGVGLYLIRSVMAPVPHAPAVKTTHGTPSKPPTAPPADPPKESPVTPPPSPSDA